MVRLRDSALVIALQRHLEHLTRLSVIHHAHTTVDPEPVPELTLAYDSLTGWLDRLVDVVAGMMTSEDCTYVHDVSGVPERTPSPEPASALPCPTRHPSQCPTHSPTRCPSPNLTSRSPKGVGSCLNYTRNSRSTAMVTTAMVAQMQLKTLKTLQQLGEGTWFCEIMKVAGLGGGNTMENGKVTMGMLGNFVQVDEVSPCATML